MLGPLIISHAACKGHAPENTLAGVHAALDFGVDAIEIDVHATREGVPVLIHDATLERTTDRAGRVAEMSLDQLHLLDAGGTRFGGRFAGERVPTLAEVLDLTRHRCLLVIEIKARGIERAVASVIRGLDAAESAMVWSFHPETVSAARAIMPDVPAARLWGGQTGDAASVIAGTVRQGAQAVSVEHSVVDKALVRAARLRGLSLFTWTPDEMEDQARLAAAGVDGICTNLPDRLRTVLKKEKYKRSGAGKRSREDRGAQAAQ